MTYYAPLFATLVTMLTIAILLLSKAGKTIQDIPNERSLHSKPIPRVGGLALGTGVCAGWMVLDVPLTWWIFLPILALFIVSILDDMRGLPVWIRFIAHIVAAGTVVIGSGLMAAHGALLAVIALLYVVWMTNLYNFMDGSDGLAGGMALFGFAFYGLAAALKGDYAIAMLNFSISAAAFGFLCYNFHPAKIFMGDAGSIPLGFFAATMGLWGWQCGLWPNWFPFLVFSPFVVDATVTLFKRMRHGEKLSQAHRSHYYQRLVQMGWGHRNTALAEYVLMMLVGASALLGGSMNYVVQAGLLLVWCGIYLALMRWVDKRWRIFLLQGKKIAST